VKVITDGDEHVIGIGVGDTEVDQVSDQTGELVEHQVLLIFEFH